jgi:hypothetical protein
VGDALGMLLDDLHRMVNRRLHTNPGMAAATAEVVDTVLKWWPDRIMARYAARGEEGPVILDALSVIAAKALEDLEHRWGTDTNTLAAIDRLVMPVVVELASVWFASVESRVDMRRCMWEARHRSRA